jgi:ribosomal protein S18 acetylase RimI-like enzyme
MQDGRQPLGDLARLRLREATLDDVRVLAEQAEALSLSENDPLGYISPATMARDLARGELHAVVAELDGAIVGYCLYHYGYESTYAASGFYIVDLFVVAGRRRLGIGRALVAELARRAKAAGDVFVWWTSRPANAAAQAAYARLGAHSEPVIAHALFDDAFEQLAAEGAARQRRD